MRGIEFTELYRANSAYLFVYSRWKVLIIFLNYEQIFIGSL